MSDDTDDQIHVNSLLASAYLDGEATSDERALVETSPEALAEVDALTQVRTVMLATAPTPTLSEREGHLAGALDVWERMSDLERSGEITPASGVDAAAAAAVITPMSTSEGRRNRGDRGAGKRVRSIGASQWFLGAAATLVVVAGAAAVVRGILDQDPDSNDVAVEQDADASPELSELEAAEADEVIGNNVGTDLAVDDPESIADEAQANPQGDAEDGGLFPDDAESDEFNEAAEESDAAESAPAPEEQPAPAPEIDLVELETLDDLADYGALAVRAVTGVSVPTTDFDAEPPAESCEAVFGIEERLEVARYQGEIVFVGVDTDGDTVFAFTDDCTLVASTPLPTPTTQP